MSNQNNNQNYNEIGYRIQESVAEALKTGDFGKLNVEITSTVKSVLNEVGDQLNSAVSDARNSVNGQPYRTYGSYQSLNDPASRGFTNGGRIVQPTDRADDDIRRHHEQRSQLVKKAQNKVKFNEVGGVTGYTDIVAGSTMFVVGVTLATIFASAPLLILIPMGLLISARGANKIKWLNLAKRYKKLSSEKLYIGVDALAEATGTSQKKTVKNIKKMLAKGFFPEGYLDDKDTTFMVSKKIYDQYIETVNNQMRLVEEEAMAQQSGETSQSSLNSMISEGMRYIDRLHELNQMIPGVVITQKLDRLESLLNEIFNGLREHPDQMGNCRKLMEYYLPTMIKLVEAYAEYDKVSQPGEDISSAKTEIENTLDIINQAFVELLNKLYQSSTWDVTAEAKVLKTMLHQDGLTEEGNKRQIIDADFFEVEEKTEENVTVPGNGL